jgi:23S rRNA (pseudouridine1915-N3)-methyltransferase
MFLTLAHIGPRKSRNTRDDSPKALYEGLTRTYLDRIAPYFPCQDQAFSAESDFLTWLANPRQPGPRSTATSRHAAIPMLLDSGGRQLSSTEFAAWLGARRDNGAQHIALAIGPAGGWSPAATEFVRRPGGQAGLLLSFGAITMTHDLARLVLAEQLYRACTILAGHPYHCGH